MRRWWSAEAHASRACAGMVDTCRRRATTARRRSSNGSIESAGNFADRHSAVVIADPQAAA